MEGTDYRLLMDKTYMGAWDLSDEEDKVFTISKVRTGEVTNEQHETQKKILIKFKEFDKEMVVNTTNAEAISKVANSKKVERWIGIRVALYPIHNVKAFGKLRDAIRVRDYPPKLPEVLTCADCGKPITDHGKYSAKSIAESSRGKYGRALCWECAEKAKQAESEKAKESDVL